MKYFTGSRRRVRKNSSHLVSNSGESGALETENASTNNLMSVDSPETKRVQRKRSRVSDKTEKDKTTGRGSKKRKSPSTTRKSQRQPVKNEFAKQKNDQEESVSHVNTTQTRKKKLDYREQLLSDSESNMSNERDSLIVQNACESLSDRNFLQQQIKLLKTPFLLEEDCPALAKIRANDRKHIPFEVIHNTLRKVNHKTEDEVLQSLNRQAQRKVLTSLQDARQEKCEIVKATSASVEQLRVGYKEIQTRVANLERVHNEIKQHHAQHKHIGVLVSQLETISEEFTSKTLIQQVQRTSTLVSGEWTAPALSDNTPSTHQELVRILFKD